MILKMGDTLDAFMEHLTRIKWKTKSYVITSLCVGFIVEWITSITRNIQKYLYRVATQNILTWDSVKPRRENSVIMRNDDENQIRNIQQNNISLAKTYRQHLWFPSVKPWWSKCYSHLSCTRQDCRWLTSASSEGDS